MLSTLNLLDTTQRYWTIGEVDMNVAFSPTLFISFDYWLVGTDGRLSVQVGRNRGADFSMLTVRPPDVIHEAWAHLEILLSEFTPGVGMPPYTNGDSVTGFSIQSSGVNAEALYIANIKFEE